MGVYFFCVGFGATRLRLSCNLEDLGRVAPTKSIGGIFLRHSGKYFVCGSGRPALSKLEFGRLGAGRPYKKYRGIFLRHSGKVFCVGFGATRLRLSCNLEDLGRVAPIKSIGGIFLRHSGKVFCVRFRATRLELSCNLEDLRAGRPQIT